MRMSIHKKEADQAFLEANDEVQPTGRVDSGPEEEGSNKKAPLSLEYLAALLVSNAVLFKSREIKESQYHMHLLRIFPTLYWAALFRLTLCRSTL